MNINFKVIKRIMKTLVKNFILTFGVIIGLNSCDNNSEPDSEKSMFSTKYPVSEILCSVNNSEESPYMSFNYDNGNRIIGVMFDGEEMYRFSYNPLKVTCNMWDGISYQSLAKNGYLEKISIDDDGTTMSFDFEYDSSDHLLSIVRSLNDLSVAITNISWKDNRIVAVKTTSLSGGEYNIPDYEIVSTQRNQCKQWTTAVAQLVGFEDGFFPLIMCGLLGRAPEYLPTEVTATHGNYSVITKLDYKFNSDGSIATENGTESYAGGYSRNMTMYYKY